MTRVLNDVLENIANQWKQALSSISTASGHMLFENELGTLSKKTINEQSNIIYDNSKLISDIILDFKEYFKTDNKLEKTNIKKYIEKTLKLISTTLQQKGIEVIVNVDSQDIYLIKSLFTQVLLNLINNAKDALIENKSYGNRYIFIQTTITKKTIDITIKDNAGGIPKDIIEHIFDQYFTTKKQSSTDIGLYLSKKIIQENMGGTIYAKNKEFHINNILNKGVEFCISFKKNNQNRNNYILNKGETYE